MRRLIPVAILILLALAAMWPSGRREDSSAPQARLDTPFATAPKIPAAVAPLPADEPPVELDDAPAPPLAASASCELTGDVLSTRGSVAGVRVRAQRLDTAAGPEATSAVAEDSGRFTFAGLPCGRYRVLAFAAGFLSAEEVVELPLRAALVIALEPDPGMQLLVTDADDRPIAGATVRALSRTGGLAGAASVARTQGDGRAHLTGGPSAADARLALEVRVDGRPPLRVDFPVAELRAGRAQARLPTLHRLAARVVGADGAPVAGALASWTRADGVTAPPLGTTEAGELAWQQLAAGIYSLVATTADRGIGRVEGIEVGGASSPGEVVIHLVPGPGSLRGVVQDRTGSGQEGFLVRLQLGERIEVATHAGPHGAFALGGLPAREAGREWRLSVEKKGWTRAEQRLDAGVEQITVAVERTGAVTGIVRGAAGTGRCVVIAELEGAAGEERAARRRMQSSASDGRFRLEDLPPGTYAVSALVAGVVQARATGVLVRPGEETGGVELEVGPLE